MHTWVCRTRRSPKGASVIQVALHASGLSLPPKKVTVNLAPAVSVERTQPIPGDALSEYVVLGELSLD